SHLGPERDFLGTWLPGFLMIGTGVGLTFSAIVSAAVAALPPERFATGSAVNNTARQMGAVLGVAVLVTIINAAGSAALREGLASASRSAALCGAASGVPALFLGRARAAAPQPARADALPAAGD